MDKHALKNFEKLERAKAELITHLDAVIDKDFTKKSDPASWSVAQVMSHLVKVEEGSMRYMKKKLLSDGPLPNQGIGSYIRGILIPLFFALPLRFKANPILADKDNTIAYSESKYNWQKCRNELEKFLEGLTSEQLNSPIFKNFGLGRISFNQHLIFLYYHLMRHTKQIKKIIKQND